jgi:putative ATP-dependent endonuclease of OLD family
VIIKSVGVDNFRCVQHEVLTCGCLTALVGANGSGKSTFLNAIDLFYSTSPKVVLEDFYNGDVGNSIRITVTFRELDESEKKRFQKYLQDDELSVVRVLSLEEGKLIDKHHGSTMQNPDFVNIRKAGAATAMRPVYSQLQESEKYKGLRKWKNQSDALAALDEWEAVNQNECQWELDDGQFFGFKQVAQGYLGACTRYLYIPAVRDAAGDATEGRGSPITQLMDLVVRSLVQNRTDFKEFREQSDRRYGEIFNPANLTELGGLADDLSKTLQQYIPDSAVDLDWLTFSGIDIPMPQAHLKLLEDGYKSEVERAGHGLQRAFIMSLLQHLAVARAKADAEASMPEPSSMTQAVANEKSVKMPNLILAIEEPELYQHPGRQRHLADILMKLSRGQIPGVAEQTQVIYCTHSPLFISLDRFDEVRLARKVQVAEGKPKASRLITYSLDYVADRLWTAEGMTPPKYTGETLKPRLAALFDQVSEGFFASVAVLVEGISDRAAIIGAALASGYNLESMGISVIPCGGKHGVGTAAAVFIPFLIPTYCVWDSDEQTTQPVAPCEKCKRPLDKESNPAENRRLLRLLGLPEEDWPSHIKEKSACFKTDRETVVKAEMGEEVVNRILDEQMTLFNILKRDHALKNPRVVSAVISSASKLGKISPSLDLIVKNVLAMKR